MSRLMSVQVKKCQLRKRPSFMANIVGRLDYGDRVILARESHSWAQVVCEGKKFSGWVHISALTTKKIILNPNSEEAKGSASSEEIALAGKGFNEQVEEKFKQAHQNIDFTWVDKMQKFVISPKEIQVFLRQGGLRLEGGDG